MGASLGSLLQLAGGQEQEGMACVECGRPIQYIEARTPYEKLIKSRQINHRLCQRCARTTAEVGEDLDGLRRKKRFLRY